MSARLDRARALYAAWSAGDREAIEALLAEEFTFSAPPDLRAEVYFGWDLGSPA